MNEQGRGGREGTTYARSIGREMEALQAVRHVWNI